MISIDLTGKHALVTGGSSGIGAAIVRSLANAGADVAINYLEDDTGRDSQAARQVADEASANGVRAITVPANVADAGEVAHLFRTLDDQFGGIDILVNNAGIDGPRARCWESEPEHWQRVVQVNLFGAYHCCREAMARMVPARQGVIVNVSSVHERIPWAGYSAYTCSKAAVNMLTQTLAQEGAEAGVRVAAVAPGAIKTPINQDVWSQADNLRDLLDKIPEHRMGSTEEVARMVTVLASDLASYVTGPSLTVDGGMVLYSAFEHGG